MSDTTVFLPAGSNAAGSEEEAGSSALAGETIGQDDSFRSAGSDSGDMSINASPMPMGEERVGDSLSMLAYYKGWAVEGLSNDGARAHCMPLPRGMPRTRTS